MIDYRKTIMSQFSGSPTITGILTAINEAMSTETDMAEFYNMIVNLDTANDGGLDIWGAIVGVPRRIKVETVGDVIGFSYNNWNADSPWHPFSQAPWFGGYQEGLVEASDLVYRRLIIAKAAANISGGTIPDLNRFLTIYSKDRGTGYARDNDDLTITYILDYSIDDFDCLLAVFFVPENQTFQFIYS